MCGVGLDECQPVVAELHRGATHVEADQARLGDLLAHAFQHQAASRPEVDDDRARATVGRDELREWRVQEPQSPQALFRRSARYSRFLRRWRLAVMRHEFR